jgi:hypothetical protein
VPLAPSNHQVERRWRFRYIYRMKFCSLAFRLLLGFSCFLVRQLIIQML